VTEVADPRPRPAPPGLAEGSLLVEQDGPVTILRLNRPAMRNAVDARLVDRLETALDAVEDDGATRAVVLTGAPPGFCAGSDLSELSGLAGPDMVRHERDTGRLARRLGRLPLPVVAAVEGFAMGGGFLLAVACDVVVSAADARWHLPEVALGWVPPWGLAALAARTGPSAARRLVWGAEPVPVAELHRLGVVDQLVDPGATEQRALRLGSTLAGLPASAVAATKRILAGPTAAENVDEDSVRAFGADCGGAAARATLRRYAGRRA
jgi:enoyl-CoA hydratase/carnithine racemase